MTKKIISEAQLRKLIRREILLIEADDMKEKPKLYFLIGPPAVGKSTWIKSNLSNDVVIVNRDEMVEKIAKESGVGTYDEMYIRPPKEITPDGMITKEMLEDPKASDAVDVYVKDVAAAAAKFNRDPKNAAAIKKYGKLIPFNRESFETVLIKFGVKPQIIVPFEYSTIKKANDDVTSLLNLTRSDTAKSKKSMAIDMVNMSKGERDQHRKFLLNALDDPSADPLDVNKYYEQIAIVFAPRDGYTPELIEKIKNRANQRASEIKAAGGSKTIPASTYDKMFASFAEPTTEEGFSSIEYVGIPSLDSLKESLQCSDTIMVERWHKLAGLIT